MKVAEKGSDRTAEAHLRADGIVEELQEFGEYIDDDGAICSYVAMEEGSVIKLEAKFSGTTMAIAYDAIVDGVLRASNVFHGKNVTVQKNRKLTHDKFLYRKEDDILYTSMKVSPVIGIEAMKRDGPETMGTLELRLYVLRQLGEEHSVAKVLRYDNQEDFAGEDQDKAPLATYTAIAPDLKMVFEEDSLSISESSPIVKRVEKPRPGNAPWAIFRFKYRTREAIEAQELPVTFDGKKTKGEIRVIDLGPVPHLNIGDRPTKSKEKDDSAATSALPDTPIKKPTAEQNTEKNVAVLVDESNKSSSQRGVDTKTAITESITTPKTAHPCTREKDKPETPALKKPARVTLSAPPTSATSVPMIKRAADDQDERTPEPKRIQTTQLVTSTRATPSTAVPSAKKTLTLAETRKQLEKARTQREQLAKKQEQLSLSLEPYKQRIEEELARMIEELEAEKRLLYKEALAYKEDEAMLEDFKKRYGDS